MVVTDTQQAETICEALDLIRMALDAIYAIGLPEAQTAGLDICALASRLGPHVHHLARAETPLASRLADVQGRLADVGTMLQWPDDPEDPEADDAP
jgi:hypothetical protein